MEGARAVDEPPEARSGSTRATTLLSFGLVANLAAQMTFAATLPEIAAARSLDASESGWIGGIYCAGYAIAVPFLAGATDRIDGRRLYVGSALLGAAASLAFAAIAHGFVLALILRFLGGVGLAGVHMPGLNLLMDRVDRSHQGRAAGIYTSSYDTGNHERHGAARGLCCRATLRQRSLSAPPSTAKTQIPHYKTTVLILHTAT